MSRRPSMKCRAANCPALVIGSRYCPACTKRREVRRNSDRGEFKRFYSTPAWRRFRDTVLRHCPLCKRCNTAPATEVHHVRTLRDHPEDAFDWQRVDALCKSCHSHVTAKQEGFAS